MPSFEEVSFLSLWSAFQNWNIKRIANISTEEIMYTAGPVDANICACKNCNSKIYSRQKRMMIYLE